MLVLFGIISVDVSRNEEELHEARKKMIAAGIDFYSMLRYWPVTWDKWRCIGAAFVSVVGAPISAVVIGKRLQTQFGPEKVPLAMAIVPLFIAVPVGLFHAQLVMKPMAEQRETVCPVCMQVR